MALISNKISDNSAEQLSPEKTRRLIHTDNMMMAVWEFSDGPWAQPEAPHSHPHEQLVYLAEGSLRFFVEEESTLLVAGDTIAVPGGLPHTIQLLTEKVRLVDIWTPLREDFLTGK